MNIVARVCSSLLAALICRIDVQFYASELKVNFICGGRGKKASLRRRDFVFEIIFFLLTYTERSSV